MNHSMVPCRHTRPSALLIMSILTERLHHCSTFGSCEACETWRQSLLGWNAIVVSFRREDRSDGELTEGGDE
jgi:hypothetical protein